MNAQTIAVPRRKPRNRVVIALALLVRAGSGRHRPIKRLANKGHKDLAERERDIGEW